MRIPLTTIRGRFVALLLFGAAPLLFMGGVIADQNYRLLSEQSRQLLTEFRATALSRQRAFLWEAERLLSALALTPTWLESEAQACSIRLAGLLTMPGDRYGSLVFVDPARRSRCAATVPDAQSSSGPVLPVPATTEDDTGLTPQEAEVVAKAQATGRFAVGEITLAGAGTRDAGRAVLPVALPLPGLAGAKAGSSGTLVATINERGLLLGADQLGRRGTAGAWIIGPSGAVILLAGSADGAMPGPSDFARLAHSDDQVMEASAGDGRRYVYALAQLPAGMRLVLVEPVAKFLTVTELAFGWRLAELAFFLVLGLALMTVGADLAIGQPLLQVGHAVARWRAGGRFDPSAMKGAPVEITALARSFAEAIAALDMRERQLRDAAVQQELLMQEIHHRVKNNLQVVASLLNLQASRITHPGTRAEFHAARDRIQALATLHRHLYSNGDLHTINMRGFLQELCNQLLRAMGEAPAGERIMLTIEASELRISSDQAVPMALLVTEAVSNAVKYAFPGGRSGHIEVRLTLSQDEAGREIALLTIDDDGVGIPAGRLETESGMRDGIGLRLIRGFAAQLGATLTVTEENGTHYAVRMAVRRERPAGWTPSDPDGLDKEI